MATVTRPSTALPDPGDAMEAEQVRDWTNNILTFLEGKNFDESNVDTTSTDGIVGMSAVQTLTGLKSLESIAAAAGGVREVLKLGLDPASGTVAAADGARITVYADDAAGTAGNRGYLDLVLEAVTAGAVDAYWQFYADVVDTPISLLTLGKADTHFDLIGPARTHTADASAYVMYVRASGARVVPTGTAALVATARFDEPNITATGTVTEAATVYIGGAPTEGAANYALHIASGAVLLGGSLSILGTYSAPLLIGTKRLWEDATNDTFRVKTGANPSNETDGDILFELED